MSASVFLTGDVIRANQCLVLAEMNVRRVIDWIVGKWGTTILQIVYTTCVNEG